MKKIFLIGAVIFVSIGLSNCGKANQQDNGDGQQNAQEDNEGNDQKFIPKLNVDSSQEQAALSFVASATKTSTATCSVDGKETLRLILTETIDGSQGIASKISNKAYRCILDDVYGIPESNTEDWNAENDASFCRNELQKLVSERSNNQEVCMVLGG